MWPFKRKRQAADNADTSKVPQEVKDYYQAERREHLGMAWLLAFVSLIVTMAVVIGLFFGGRWAYRKLAHKQTNAPTQQTATTTSSKPKPASKPQTPPKPSTNQPAQTKPGPSATSQPTQTTAPSTTTAPTSQPNTPVSQPSTPTTSQPTTQNLTNTGPGNTVAIFVGVTAVATIAHASYRKRKLSSTNS